MTKTAPFDSGGVRGFLHEPDGGARRSGIVLTHGAGGDCRMPLLVKASDALSAAGLWVLRYDLPFRQRRPKGPPSPSTATADRAGLREAAAAMRGLAKGPVFLGGQSYGGRQATMLLADEPEVADALLLFSYPLHPPGKPERLRTEHFPRLRAPALFVHGVADPFGSVAELTAAVALAKGPTRIIPVEGAGHDLKRGAFDLTGVATAFLEHAARQAA